MTSRHRNRAYRLVETEPIDEAEDEEARLWYELRLSPMAESLGLRKPKATLDGVASGIPPPVIEQLVAST